MGIRSFPFRVTIQRRQTNAALTSTSRLLRVSAPRRPAVKPAAALTREETNDIRLFRGASFIVYRLVYVSSEMQASTHRRRGEKLAAQDGVRKRESEEKKNIARRDNAVHLPSPETLTGGISGIKSFRRRGVLAERQAGGTEVI